MSGALVQSISDRPSVALRGPLQFGGLGRALGHRMEDQRRPVAVRIDGRFEHVRVRSVPRPRPPYPPLAEALAHQRVSDLDDVAGTMVGFCFPSALEGIEMIGWQLHFATDTHPHGVLDPDALRRLELDG